MSRHTLPFRNELMCCAFCRLTQQSDPQIESGWYALDTGTTRVYCCPGCMGNVVTSRCPTCQRYYHEEYRACPWCQPA
jgi:hypothetical protein